GVPLHRFLTRSTRDKRLTFTPDGRWLLGHGNKGVTVWDVATGEPLLSGEFQPGSFTKDGRCFAASTTGAVAFCELRPAEVVRSRSGHQSGIARLAWAADHRHLVTLDDTFSVCVWDAARGELLDQFQPQRGGFWAHNAAVALSPDGSRVAFASGGNEM